MAENDRKMHYHDYLHIDQILSAQVLESEKAGRKPAHEEMLFIIIHQTYELWFKQIIHELSSVVRMFNVKEVDERNIGVATGRLRRVIEIQEVLVSQVRVLETMTSLDFLEFRSYLFPASGFQSFQFRQIEAMMGLEEEHRLRYGPKPYHTQLHSDQAGEIQDLEDADSLFECMENWLERTPFLHLGDFEFLKYYKQAVEDMIAQEKKFIQVSTMDQDEKDRHIAMLEANSGYYEMVLDESKHAEMQASGQVRLSYKASMAALLIHLYRDEPILHGPFNFLSCLKDMDEMFTTWRYRHAQMVLRMIGRKVGTGGSSGHDYLRNAASQHQVFKDLYNISTLLIPRSSLPPLPTEIKQQLGFYFTSTDV